MLQVNNKNPLQVTS